MYKLFNLKEEDNNISVLYVTLPEGKTMAELTRECSGQIRDIIMQKRVFGRDIRVFGRITTSMAMVLGHELCHVARSVSMKRVCGMYKTLSYGTEQSNAHRECRQESRCEVY